MVGTELHNLSSAEVARVFGAQGMRVEPERLAVGLQEALNSGEPTVIEVPSSTWIPPFQVTPRAE